MPLWLGFTKMIHRTTQLLFQYTTRGMNRLLICTFVFMFSGLYPMAMSKQIPLRDFFKNPNKKNFKISPDGEFIAFLQPWENRMNLFVQKWGEQEAIRITSEKERDIAEYLWKGEQRLLFTKDFKGDENFHILSVNRDGTQLKDLTPFEKVRAEFVDDLRDVSEKEVLIQLNQRKKEVFDAYRLNVETGELTLMAENPGNITSWITDHNGQIRAATDSDGVNTRLLYRSKETDPFKIVLTTSFKESVVPKFFSFDNEFIYAISNLSRDKAAVVEFDIQKGKEKRLTYQRQDVDVNDLQYSRKRKVLTLISFVTWKQERFFLDQETETIYSKLSKLLPDLEVSIVSSNKNEDKSIVHAFNDRSLGSYYLYDVPKNSIIKLADISPWLNSEELAEVKPISFQSRDGLTLHGYLTLPPNKEARNLPVVVHPHGGPWWRDVWRFDPNVQFLANRGYAVLQVNFRGSTGYGRKFWEASFKEWGKKMQDDISDGVQFLIDQKIADSKRVAIFGGSYGGYATLAGLAFTPDLYACGIDFCGISNLFTFMHTIPPYRKPQIEMLYEMVGHPEKDKQLLESASPVFHVDKIKAPLFVAQGAHDPRVNIDESNQMVEALKKRGIDVPYMVKENEGHGFRNEENRFDFYEAMEKFLAKHIGN